MKTVFFFTLTLIISGVVQAQLSKTEKDQIIDSLCVKLEQYYVYSDKAEKAITLLRDKQKGGSYNSISDISTFVFQVSSDLRQSGKDKHLRLEYSDVVLPDQNDDPYTLTAEEEEEMQQYTLQENFGIRKVDILKGNIGLLDFSCIFGANYAGEKYTDVMNYLSHTDALIIDLRNCRGGMGTDGNNFLASYFFEEPVHWIDLVWRKDNKVDQKWTYAYVPGKRYQNKPVYIVTSARTFSGGEDFAYNMQALKRATILGEQTKGGANPGATIKLNDHFCALIPNGKAVNPITHSNWEAIGVKPDIFEKGNMALYEAYLLALKGRIAETKDEHRKTFLEDVLTYNISNPPAFKLETFELNGHLNASEVYLTGTFNYWAQKTIPMKKTDNGWTATVECELGMAEYRFIVDDIQILDPDNKQIMRGLEYTNSARIIQ